jgi:hypothetical protein
MCSVGDFVLMSMLIGCFGVGWLVMDVAGGVVATLQLALPALLLYGLWKIGKFIIQIVFPFGYPRQIIQPSAPGAHPPPQPAAGDYMFRLGRFQAPQVVHTRIDNAFDSQDFPKLI